MSDGSIAATMTPPTLDIMVRQIAAHGELDASDLQAIGALPFTTHAVPPGGYLTREGQPVRDHTVLLSGYTQRNKLSGAGGRQIVAIQIPGEAIACSSLFFTPADHSTQALTPVEAAAIPREAFRALIASRQPIAHAILCMTLIETAIGAEWLLNLGRRSAKARIAHLICELATRIDAARLREGPYYALPLTQEQLGDALGLTPVHVNRMLRELSEEGLIERSGRRMHFPDRKRLEQVADFNPAYLRLNRTGWA